MEYNMLNLVFQIKRQNFNYNKNGAKKEIDKKSKYSDERIILGILSQE